jgi:hypothetical protein
MILLGGSTLLIAILNKKLQPNTLILLKNSFICYIGLGSMIVPEVFNPFVYKWI